MGKISKKKKKIAIVLDVFFVFTMAFFLLREIFPHHIPISYNSVSPST